MLFQTILPFFLATTAFAATSDSKFSLRALYSNDTVSNAFTTHHLSDDLDAIVIPLEDNTQAIVADQPSIYTDSEGQALPKKLISFKGGLLVTGSGLVSDPYNWNKQFWSCPSHAGNFLYVRLTEMGGTAPEDGCEAFDTISIFDIKEALSGKDIKSIPPRMRVA